MKTDSFWETKIIGHHFSVTDKTAEDYFNDELLKLSGWEPCGIIMESGITMLLVKRCKPYED